MLCGGQRDKDGRKLSGYDTHRTLAWGVTAGLWVLGFILNVVAAMAGGS